MSVGQDLIAIRGNVDDFDEAYRLLSRGVQNSCGDDAVSARTFRSAMMIASSGFAINLIHHIRK